MLKERLTGFLKDCRRQTGVPGLGVVVSIEGRHTTVMTGSRVVDRQDLLAADTQFHVGCIAKLFSSIVTLELARQGRLSLDAPIAEYLPELRQTVHGETVAPVHLLSHTSGYKGTDLVDADARMLSWARF